jgi:hypothetical protein
MSQYFKLSKLKPLPHNARIIEVRGYKLPDVQMFNDYYGHNECITPPVLDIISDNLVKFIIFIMAKTQK